MSRPPPFGGDAGAAGELERAAPLPVDEQQARRRIDLQVAEGGEHVVAGEARPAQASRAGDLDESGVAAAGRGRAGRALPARARVRREHLQPDAVGAGEEHAAGIRVLAAGHDLVVDALSPT